MNYDESPNAQKVSTETSRVVVIKTPITDESKMDKSIPTFCKLHNAEFVNHKAFEAHVKKFHPKNEKLVINYQELKKVEVTKSKQNSSANSVNSTEQELDRTQQNISENPLDEDVVEQEQQQEEESKSPHQLIDEAIGLLIHENVGDESRKEKIVWDGKFVEDVAEFIVFKLISTYAAEAAKSGRLRAVIDVENEQDLLEKYRDVQDMRNLATCGEKVKAFGDISTNLRNIDIIKETAHRKIGRWHEHAFQASRKRSLEPPLLIEDNANADNSSKKNKTQ